MLKKNKLFVKIILLTLFPLIILLFSVVVTIGAYQNEAFQVYDEIKISATDMDCNYYLEDYAKWLFNFEYPKLILGDDGTPMIIFLDEKSQKVIFTEVKNERGQIVNTIPSFDKQLFEFKWPVIFVKNKIIYMAVIENGSAKNRQYRIRIFTLDKKNNGLNLYKEISVINGKIFDELNNRNCLLSGIYPYSIDSDDFFIYGRFSKSHFHLLGLTSGHFPTFHKNFSLIWKGSEVHQFEEIDEKGKFAAEQSAYVVTDSGMINAVWVRRWENISSVHDEALCFSQKNVGAKWTTPRELYTVKGTNTIFHLNNLSTIGYGNSIFIIWQDIEKGFYFTEIKNGLQQDITQLSDMKPIPFKISKYIEPLSDGADTRITVDSYGNVYALWVLNSAGKYQMFLKARINGKWIETQIVTSGNGTVKLPDMKVDEKNGFIHITYLKGSISNVACYYTKLKKLKNN